MASQHRKEHLDLAQVDTAGSKHTRKVRRFMSDEAFFAEFSTSARDRDARPISVHSDSSSWLSSSFRVDDAMYRKKPSFIWTTYCTVELYFGESPIC